MTSFSEKKKHAPTAQKMLRSGLFSTTGIGTFHQKLYLKLDVSILETLMIVALIKNWFQSIIFFIRSMASSMF